ncbi:MAG: serine/threonine protein kinase [Myxococcota bacterium]
MESSPTVADPLKDKVLVEKYRLDTLLGSGAMGTIYKAEQLALHKDIVIKLLHRHLLSDTELVARFHREARAASRLNQRNIVQIIDFGETEDGSLFIAMEYIPGRDLATVLETEYPLDTRRVIHIFKQVCLALDEAHANGVLHRDLKPENIMIVDRRNEKDVVKVVDFGIAKLEDNNPNSTRQFQTRAGIVCGTPEYMSPEQARGRPLDARSDVYALGIGLYHIITDHLPFDAESPIEIVTMHLTEKPKPPSLLVPDMPMALERLIMTMMEKDVDARPTSAMDVHAELDRIDRELATARQETFRQKRTDDATMIDVNPVRIHEAIRAAHDQETREQAASEATTARSASKIPRVARVKQHSTPSHSTPSHSQPKKVERGEGDTLVGGQGQRNAVEGLSETKPFAAPAMDAKRKGRPDTTLNRDNITINTEALPAGPDAVLEMVDPPTGNRGIAYIVALILAVALGVAAWLITGALDGG